MKKIIFFPFCYFLFDCLLLKKKKSSETNFYTNCVKYQRIFPPWFDPLTNTWTHLRLDRSHQPFVPPVHSVWQALARDSNEEVWRPLEVSGGSECGKSLAKLLQRLKGNKANSQGEGLKWIVKGTKSDKDTYILLTFLGGVKVFSMKSCLTLSRRTVIITFVISLLLYYYQWTTKLVTFQLSDFCSFILKSTFLMTLFIDLFIYFCKNTDESTTELNQLGQSDSPSPPGDSYSAGSYGAPWRPPSCACWWASGSPPTIPCGSGAHSRKRGRDGVRPNWTLPNRSLKLNSHLVLVFLIVRLLPQLPVEVQAAVQHGDRSLDAGGD